MEQDKAQALEVAVRLSHVSYAYEGSGHRYAALHDVSLEVPYGARLLLVGGNGSGKSTLLKVVAGMSLAKGTSTVLGCDAFCDTSLNEHVQFIGEPWPTSANWTSTVRQTVERYPNVDWRRFEELCHALHVDPEWRVDHCSSGMKRRIQVLLGLLYPKRVLCLDECTSDLDIVERENVLRFMRAASTAANPVTILYATHIFDHLEGWPTHIAHLHEGRLQQLRPVGELTKSLMQTAFEWIGNGSTDAAHFPLAPVLPEGAPIIQLKDLSCRVGRDGLGKFSTAKTVLQDLTLTVPRGARALLVGTNGSGKTSLLQVLAGKKYIAPGHATISGLPVFHEPKLNSVLAFSGDWWDSLPPWDLTVADLLGEAGMSDARVAELLSFLGVEVGWHVRKVSSGQRKRIQLLLNLREFRELLLLDEVTAELDIVQRVAFMQFLHRESTLRGATVLYSTHILEGLDGWASHIIGVDQLTRQCFQIPVPAHKTDVGITSQLLAVVDAALRALKDQEWEAISQKI